MGAKVLALAVLVAALTPEQLTQIRARYKAGAAFAKAGEWDKGAQVFRELLLAYREDLSHPAKVKLYYALGLSYLKANQPKRAMRPAKLCLELAPESPKAQQLVLDVLKALDEPDEPGPAPTPTPTPTPTPKPTADPAPSLEEAKKAFQDGEALYAQALALIDGAQEFEKPLAEALAKLEVARRGKYRLPRTLYLMGALRVRRADEGDPQAAIALLEESQAAEPDASTLMELAAAYGLVPDVEKEIAAYEKALELDPNNAEGHFRAAIAFDKSKRDDAPRQTFEHAKQAIRIKPDKYKMRFQSMLKNSEVAAKISELVKKIIDLSEKDELDDKKVNDFAEQFEKMLGGGGDPAKRLEKFKELLKDGKVQKLLDKLPKEQREQILKEKDPKKLLELLLKSNLTPQRGGGK